jgi:transcriptional regulator with XRE-family HTH domain
MTGEELRSARLRLRLKGVDFANAFGVNDRTLRGWETGERNNRPNPVPRPIAVLVRAALRYAWVREELGIANVRMRPKRPPVSRLSADG